MRALWIDAGNAADWDKSKKYEITAHYYALTDPVEDLHQRLLDSRNKLYGTGVYMASNWDEYKDLAPEAVARAVHDQLSFIKWPKPNWPKVQFDVEIHDSAYIAALLKRWRELRPHQDTSWTLESFQSGWMSKSFVQSVLAAKVRVVPQFYLGQMEPIAQDAALRELMHVGFPENIITGFYDAATLPLRGWNGFAFTQGRLR